MLLKQNALKHSLDYKCFVCLDRFVTRSSLLKHVGLTHFKEKVTHCSIFIVTIISLKKVFSFTNKFVGFVVGINFVQGKEFVSSKEFNGRY